MLYGMGYFGLLTEYHYNSKRNMELSITAQIIKYTFKFYRDISSVLTRDGSDVSTQIMDTNQQRELSLKDLQELLQRGRE